MDPHKTDEFVMEDQEAQLDKALVEEYLRARGCSMSDLITLPEPETNRLMTEATIYASTKLEEMKDTAQLVREVHGATGSR